VGSEDNDDPSKDISTVNGTGKRLRGLKLCKLYDDDDDDDDDDNDDDDDDDDDKKWKLCLKRATARTAFPFTPLAPRPSIHTPV
jgi:hypothetical protein